MSGSDSGAIRTPTNLPPIASIRNQGLINGTNTPLSTTVGSSNVTHLFYVATAVNVTVAETGGQITLTYTIANAVQTVVMDPGGHGLGQFTNGVVIAVDHGTQIQINQASALTLGTAALYAAIAGG